MFVRVCVRVHKCACMCVCVFVCEYVYHRSVRVCSTLQRSRSKEAAVVIVVIVVIVAGCSGDNGRGVLAGVCEVGACKAEGGPAGARRLWGGKQE